MSDIAYLLEQCRNLGATLTPINDRLRIEAPKPLPEDLVSALREAKPLIIDELRRQLGNESGCWLLEQWRKTSLPAWRRILSESIEAKDTRREEYARWMLREVLEDPEYTEAGK